jgi:hypothetical protein
LQVRGYRSAELSALALRKYLDALCNRDAAAAAAVASSGMHAV